MFRAISLFCLENYNKTRATDSFSPNIQEQQTPRSDSETSQKTYAYAEKIFDAIKTLFFGALIVGILVVFPIGLVFELPWAITAGAICLIIAALLARR